MKTRLVDDIRAAGAQPGDIELRGINGVPQGFAYRCPGCGEEDWLNIHSADGWEWNGSTDAPTLRPSILHRPCKWHGYLTAGEFVPC